MPLYTSDALILRTYKLGESDRIVVFLTRDSRQEAWCGEERAAGAAGDSAARSSR
jgi:hypothetical protein